MSVKKRSLKLQYEVYELDVLDANGEPIVENDVPKTEQYIVKELTGGGRSRYLSQMSKQVKTDDEGNVIKAESSIEGIDLMLLCNCVYGPDGALVAKDVIATWPSSVTEEMGEDANRMSKLGGKAATKKNEADARKNSESASLESGSGSPLTSDSGTSSDSKKE